MKRINVISGLLLLSSVSMADTVCNTYANQTFCSDGTVITQYGNLGFDNRGNTFTTYGNTTFINNENGSYTYKPNGHLYDQIKLLPSTDGDYK